MNFSRTGEIALGIIGAVFTFISIIIMALFVSGGSAAFQDETVLQEIESELAADPALAGEDLDIIMQGVSGFIDVFGIFGWTLVALLVISLIFNILAIINIAKNKNPKLAGIFFIVAGIFAYFLSLTSILLYIAAIMSFVRKPPYSDDQTTTSDDLSYYEPNRPL